MAFTYKSPITIKQEKMQSLIDSFRKGLSPSVSFSKVGIPLFYYFKWKKIYEDFISYCEQDSEGLDEIPELEPQPILDKNGEPCGKVYTPISIMNHLKMAYAEFVAEQNDRVLVGDCKNWQSAAWLLERRVKEDYAKEEPTTNKVDTVDSIKVVYVDPKDSQSRLSQLEKEVKESIE